ncbi:helix-turn-helix domain-containing protein [Mucilaginibacter endophyticus]|uniref:helix-turn-helix domain-containing protein n=1 Tax=Mucilaginibacter endophyticus TaxID=2675003 RepID=UPI000E0CEA44|nr:helix-turn-helix transcriptional regulator [Mucilaginibacter endophyticus]
MTTTKTIVPQQVHDKMLANRLQIFRQQYIDKSQNEAAKKLEIAQSALSYLESGRTPIKHEFIAKLVKEYGLNQDWFTSGHGKPQDKNPAKATLITDLNSLNEELNVLKKHIKIMEANTNHLFKVIGQQGKQIEALEKKLSKLS